MQPRGQLTVSVDAVNRTEDILSRPSTCTSPTFSIADILASSFQVCSPPETDCESKLPLTKPLSRLADPSSQWKHQRQLPCYFDVHHSQPLHPSSYFDVPQKQVDLHDDSKDIPLTEHCVPLVTDLSPTPELPTADARDNSAVKELSSTNIRPASASVRTPNLVKSSVFRVDIPGTIDGGIRSQCYAPTVEQFERCAPKDTMKAGVSCFNCGSCGVDSGRRVPSGIANTLNILVDAARCVRAETQLEEAEAVLEHLIVKFAEPSDLYTSWENLVDDHKSREDAGMMKQQSSDSCEIPSLAAVSFSPIFKLLLSQPEARIFPDLYRPTAPGRQLQELCNQLASAIRRTKRKLRVLQRMKSGQARTPLLKDDLRQNPSGKVDHLSSHNRRTAFIDRLRRIWPGFRELDASGLPVRQTEPVTRSSLNVHLPKLSPHMYTNPMECPLSLLSFVSNLIDSRLPRSQEVVIPHEIDTREKIPEELSSSAKLRFHDDLNSSMQRPENMNKMDNSTNDTNRRPQDDARWLSVARINTATSYGGSASAPPSFSSSSASPSSCSTNSCGQRHISKRSCFRWDKRSQWTRSLQRLPSVDTETEGFPGGNALRPRRRPRKWGSGPMRSKRKRLIREDESFHTTSVTNVTRTNTPVGRSNKSNENPVTLIFPQAISKVLSPSPIQSDAVQSTWTELNIVVRDSEPSDSRLDWENKPGYPGHLSISAIHSPSAISDIVTTHSAPCMSFTDSSSTTSQLLMDRSMDFLSPSGHGDSSHFSDEPAWSNTTRPPTPDIRRSDLDVTDLSDGTRVLIIEDTHLRAGTLYLCRPLNFSSFSTENRREYLFRIHLDADRSCTNAGHTPARRSSSPTRITTCESPIPVTSKKRRQSDILLHGWQVMQQAVLEVFPASLRHLPPGTRVCAAWSEQLASNLYPGTVVEAESADQVQLGCVAVDFDDGDHRQVPLHNIRLLPDHFANLHQLANEAGVDGLINPIISPARFPPSEVYRICSGTTRPRVRRHSAVSAELPVSIPVLTARRGLNRTFRGRRICPQFALDATTPHDELRNDTNPSGAVRLGKFTAEAPKDSSTTDLPHTSSSNMKTEPMTNMSDHRSVISPKMDPEVPFDTMSSTSDSSDSRGWSILEKLKRRKHGRLCCRSIVRETDGSVVSIGDAVEFSSENDDVYLGEVREIQWNEAINNLVVVAAWFYHPKETGSVGSQITYIKGALFATAHLDENEARCINRRVTVLTSYAEYRRRMGTIESKTDANQNDGVGRKSDDPHRCSDEPQTTIVADPFESSDTQDAQSTATSERTEDAMYFIAGKYDPVNRRVLSWDPDIEKLIKRDK